MEIIESILIVSIFIAVAAFAYTQWSKSKELQNIYNELSEEEKKQIDKQEAQEPKLFAYAKPMNKSMWIATIIGIAIFVWVLISKVTAL